jgi:NADH:ubiquinone oxidoreductase subunit 3 (subunit A)
LRIEDRGTTDARPPILGSWPRLYAAVLLFLAFDVIVFYLFTKAFA